MGCILIMWKIYCISQSLLPQLPNENNKNRPKADIVTAFLCHFVQTCYSNLVQDIMSNPVVLECQSLADYTDSHFVWMFQHVAYFRV